MSLRVLGESYLAKPVVASNEQISKTCSKHLDQKIDAKCDKPIQLIRSKSDKLEYKVIQLENAIRICLISDTSNVQDDHASSVASESGTSEASSSSSSDGEQSDHDSVDHETKDDKKKEKMAAILVGLKVGSLEDPHSAPGMAHMLEHMLTMGSKKYPAENYIDEFLLARGGYQNAHTDYEATVYEIELHRKHLKDAMPVIAQAFVAPLLREESIAKEIKAVDTEFYEVVNDDSVRTDLILNHIAKKAHPFNKFMWGNHKSLVDFPRSKGLHLHKLMLDFYRNYYGPSKMFVVIQSQHSIEQLQTWASQAFSEVPAKPQLQASPVSFEKCGLPFDDDESKRRFNSVYIVESIETGTNLVIHWCFPPVVEKYMFNPLDYYENLIGHEGRGSLFSELRKRNLAVDLCTDSSSFKENHVFCLFYVTIQLTDHGRDNIEEVVGLFFEYIAMLRRSGAQEYFYRECQNIALNTFNFRNEEDALSYANDIIANLMNYPVEHMLTGNQLYYRFDKHIIDSFLDFMLPEKTNFTILGGKFLPNHETLEEPWIKTKYQVLPLPDSWRGKASKCRGDSPYFHYPRPNQFIATNFDLLKDTIRPNGLEFSIGNHPKLIYESPRLSLWYKPDFNFNLPQGVINLHIMSPVLRDSLENVVLFDVFLDYYVFATKEDTYDATMAEIEFDINYTDSGFVIKIRGFNEKLPALLIVLLDWLVKLQFDPKYLDSLQKKVIKMYNDSYQEPETFSHQLRLHVLQQHHFDYLERWPLVAGVTTDKLHKFKQQLLLNLTCSLHVQGNLSSAITLDLCSQIEKIFDLKHAQGDAFEKKHDRVRKVCEGVTEIRALTLNAKNSITSTDYYVQLCPLTIQHKSYLSLFVYAINELCFNVLRTNKGLGYRVGCSLTDTYGILGYLIHVGSCANKFSGSQIDKCIQDFIDVDCRKHVLEEIDQNKFESFVSTLITQRQLAFVNLYQEAKLNWDCIRTFDYCFNRNDREVVCLSEFTLDAFQTWARDTIFVAKENRKVMIVQVTGNGEKSLEECSTLDGKQVKFGEMHKTQDGGDDYRPKALCLLKSKCGGANFVVDLKGLQQSLALYPVQPALRDVV